MTCLWWSVDAVGGHWWWPGGSVTLSVVLNGQQILRRCGSVNTVASGPMVKHGSCTLTLMPTDGNGSPGWALLGYYCRWTTGTDA